MSSYFKHVILPVKLKESSKIEKLANEALIKLEACNAYECLTMAAKIKQDLQNELAARKKLIEMSIDTFDVKDIFGKDTKIIAKAWDKNIEPDRDYGVLMGDFKNFEKLPVNLLSFNVMPSDTLRTCGYANGMAPPVCSNFVAAGNYNFQYTGVGYIVRGMSGGPVIDENGVVVGINTAVHENRVIIMPIMGIIAVPLK